MCRDSKTPLRDHLYDIRERYLSAAAKGEAALLGFDGYWNDLASQIIAGIEEGSVSEDVLRLAYNSAAFIAACGKCIVACEQSAVSMISETGYALARLTLNDPISPSSRLDTHNSPPPYIPAAYEWLMDHIHNPYPSIRERLILASLSGFSTQVIHDWFKNVRRRIGWVDFCNRHFRGSRALAAEAASRVLLAHEFPCSVPVEVEVDVLSLRGAAECLYPAHQISDDGVAGWTPFLPRHRDYGCDTGPFTTTSSLWPNSSAIDIPPSKLFTPPSDFFTATCPSNIESRTLSSGPSAVSRSRKRRLSDAGIEESRKKFRIVPGEPRRQVVSDPLPCPSVPESENPDTFWRDVFDSTLLSFVTDVDTSRPVSIVSSERSTSATDEQLATLSSFYTSILPENEQRSVAPIIIPQTMEMQDSMPPLPLANPNPLNESLLFADPTLEVDSLSQPATDHNLEQLLSSFASLDHVIESSVGLSDSSSDTSSILTLSPPRTPVLHSLGLTDDCLPEMYDQELTQFPNLYSPGPPFFEFSSMLDNGFGEKEIEQNSISHTLSLAESCSLFDPTSSARPVDFSSYPALLAV